MAPALALGAAALFGLSAPAAKLLVGTLDPWLLAGLFYLGSWVGLLAVRLMQRGFRGPVLEASLTVRDRAAVVKAGRPTRPNQAEGRVAIRRLSKACKSYPRLHS